tara:strand:- start:367 stop:1653 length:1287 start_codon:yes stop_codon:yes gene_type:complete
MSKGKTVQSGSVAVPKYQEDAYKELYKRGAEVSKKPFVAYGGTGVAGSNAGLDNAYNMANKQTNNAGAYNASAGLMDQVNRQGNVGSTTIGNAGDINASTMNRGNVRELGNQSVLGQIGNYMNPYNQIVTDQGIRDLNRSRLTQLSSDQDAQIGRGAFGGSRGALLEAETNKNYNEQVADFVGSQNQRAFDTASGMASNDMNRQLTADTTNAGYDMNIGGRNMDANNQFNMYNNERNQGRFDTQAAMDQERNMANAQFGDAMLDRNANLYNSIFDQQTGGAAGASKYGLLDRAIDQEQLDYNRSEFDREQGFDAYNLGLYNSAVSGVPFMGANSSTSQKKTGVGDVIGTGLQIASLFSDSRLKDNIKYEFTLTSGYKIYSWDWNNKAQELGITDQATSGVIAQEVAVIKPEAIEVDASGYLKVNYGVL